MEVLGPEELLTSGELLSLFEQLREAIRRIGSSNVGAVGGVLDAISDVRSTLISELRELFSLQHEAGRDEALFNLVLRRR